MSTRGVSAKGIPIRPPVANAALQVRRKGTTSGASSSEHKRRFSPLTIIAYVMLFFCASVFTYVFGNYLQIHGLIPASNPSIILSRTGVSQPIAPVSASGSAGQASIDLPSSQDIPASSSKDTDSFKSSDSQSSSSKDKESVEEEKKPKKPSRGKPKRRQSEEEVAPFSGYEPHIQKIHGEKDGTIKQDMRVVLPPLTLPATVTHPPGEPSGQVGAPRAYTNAMKTLNSLALFQFLATTPENYPSLEATMEFLHHQPSCSRKPIFLSMASVGDDLYWQLIENFVYTMVKFDTVECSLVICVSDPKCMAMCDSQKFPCFNFKSAIQPLPSVMEQIGEVKLFHVPKALEKGVDVFMLDLDVGFLNNPMVMVDAFYATPHIDIMVQEDLIFIMNRTKAGWKTWFTQPLPNIGLFLCRGNEKTARVFSIAWAKYTKMEDVLSKSNPGKDQNHVLDAMRIGRGTFGLRYAYFSNSSAMLLDKLILQVTRNVELGGEAASNLLTYEQTIASHTTCFEHTTKVLGLKATNAFWNPLYYDPLRPTITKQILYISEMQVLDEVRTLLWLGMVTGRAVIIPNLLGADEIEGGHVHNGRVMWPGFRVAKLKREKGISQLKVNILEPAFYWRVQRDYDDVPDPTVLVFKTRDSVLDIRDTILAQGTDAPRVVLHMHSSRDDEEDKRRVAVWARDSVGIYEPYKTELRRYVKLPSVKSVARDTEMVDKVLGALRNCEDIMTPKKGNRTCFQICE